MANSLYQQVLGTEFDLLPSPIQRFHALQGRRILNGWVEVGAPTSIVARIIAQLLGAPLSARQGPIEFELNACAAEEVWTRRFPGKTMRSRLGRRAGHIVERLGFARLWFALKGGPEMLEMELVGLSFLGVPCPRWLLPTIVAKETAGPGQLHFNVHVSLPLIGVVARYRGYLELPEEGCR